MLKIWGMSILKVFGAGYDNIKYDDNPYVKLIKYDDNPYVKLMKLIYSITFKLLYTVSSYPLMRFK